MGEGLEGEKESRRLALHCLSHYYRKLDSRFLFWGVWKPVFYTPSESDELLASSVNTKVRLACVGLDFHLTIIGSRN